ncbi:MAG: proton-conducting transporter transmembrane domain-containing protein, partial [Acidimicrobiales bacterium]
PRYHHRGPGMAVYMTAYNFALLSALGVLLAANVVTFLVCWESMTLLSYLLVLRDHAVPGVAQAGFWFLALGEVGFGLVTAAFVMLAVKTHTMSLVQMAAASRELTGGYRDSVYLLALVGFGFKAGIVPLHVWLPRAHPVAPADGSGFLSGLIIKLGIYGIALFAFVLLPGGPAWWGLLTMGLGAVSAVLGILYALMELDMKRFLAYSSIENVGIIVTALGAAMTFGAYGDRTLATFLLLAALYHVLNHGVYKTLIFLDAGTVDHASGTRDMNKLGGLTKTMPVTSATALVATLGLAALPPLNGFVSEWLVFEGLFQGFRIPSHLAGTLIVLAGGALALTGGLAISAFIRMYGISFLGRPRSAGAAAATEGGQPRLAGAFLATVCVALSLGAPAVLVVLSRIGKAITGGNIVSQLVIGNLTIIPAHTDFSAFSPTYLAVFLVAVTAVPVVIFLAGRPRARSGVVPVWDGGIHAYEARMQYSATTFANPVRVTFDRLYRPDVELRRASDEDPAGRAGPVHYKSTVYPLFERVFYEPVIAAAQWLSRKVRPVQSGDVNLYLLYVFVAIVVAYFVAVV